ncbi:MAG: hypothetical protein IPP73_12810 [Chitinophagaceae bacterium]|nr:hypothetical protein [Chitinophagaceae bacterium]
MDSVSVTGRLDFSVLSVIPAEGSFADPLNTVTPRHHRCSGYTVRIHGLLDLNARSFVFP